LPEVHRNSRDSRSDRSQHDEIKKEKEDGMIFLRDLWRFLFGCGPRIEEDNEAAKFYRWAGRAIRHRGEREVLR
jgi:hypothetical protein